MVLIYVATMKQLTVTQKKSKLRKVRWLQSLTGKPCQRCGTRHPFWQMAFVPRGNAPHTMSPMAMAQQNLSKKRITDQIGYSTLLCSLCRDSREFTKRSI